MYQEVISDIAVFIEVIKTGSFIAASKKLGISKPSVSRRISDLETKLKTKLIKRTTRTLALTESGQILYDRCHNFDGVISNAMQEISELTYSPKGVIKIGFASYLANDPLFTQIISNFMIAHPKIEIEMHSYTSQRDLDAVKKYIDIFFSDYDMTSSSVISKKLVSYEKKICAAPCYIEKNGIPHDPASLTKHNCLLHRLYEEPKNIWEFHIHGKWQSIEVTGNYQATRTHFIAKMVRFGVGIAMLPDFMIEKYVDKGEIITFLHGYRCKPADVYLTKYRQKRIPQKMKIFIDYIQAIYT